MMIVMKRARMIATMMMIVIEEEKKEALNARPKKLATYKRRRVRYDDHQGRGGVAGIVHVQDQEEGVQHEEDQGQDG